MPEQRGPFDGSTPLSLGGDVVVGEGVILDLRLARIPSRSLALLIDVSIQFAVFFVLLLGSSLVFTGLDAASSAAYSILLIVLVLIVMPTVIEMLSHGRSVGKLAMGLRVVRDDGGPVRFRHSLVRAVAMVFADLWMTSGVVGLLCSLTSIKARRLGDHFAGTLVIRERIPTAASPALGFIPMPPPLIGWAARLDFTAASDASMAGARAFFFRAAALAPEVRAQMGGDIAVRLCHQLSVAYPEGAPSEAVIAAVLAERARRSSGAPMPPAPMPTQPPVPQPQVPQPPVFQPTEFQPGPPRPEPTSPATAPTEGFTPPS